MTIAAFCFVPPAVSAAEAVVRPTRSADAWSEPLTGMRFVRIPKGCFRMGSENRILPPADSYWMNIAYEQGVNEDEMPAHETCVDAFWIGAHEVRIDEWRAVMRPDEPASGTDRDLPITGITWSEALAFADRLGKRSGGKYRFRLPTEAEWEYACRAGSPEPVLPPAKLHEQAWFGVFRTSNLRPRPTGQRAPNRYGLHDMLGNVWEWTADSYLADAYLRHRLHNPRIESGHAERVIRGASLRSEAVHVRCAKRGHQDGGSALDLIGFRLVRER